MPDRNTISWNGLVSGYGMISEARKVFDKMPESGYATNSKVDVARKLFEVMLDKNDVTWTAMLTGRGTCRTHKNLDLAEIEAKKLLQLEPNNPGPYILLSNIYASQSRWKDAVELRKTMKAWNLRKSPGCS
uniref:Pentatricopeptide repeat-containing protein n=1 Tax=Salix viminalis TaxID=40686 RepID=A0A6N2LI67_SALVM